MIFAGNFFEAHQPLRIPIFPQDIGTTFRLPLYASFIPKWCIFPMIDLLYHNIDTIFE